MNTASLESPPEQASHTTKDILQYIHSDLWGMTHGGAKYFMSIIDDHSRKLWVFMLKSKDEAYEKFLEWKVLVENQTGKKVRVLRTDNGLEYLSQKFKSLCRTSGIDRHLTTARTP